MKAPNPPPRAGSRPPPPPAPPRIGCVQHDCAKCGAAPAMLAAPQAVATSYTNDAGVGFVQPDVMRAVRAAIKRAAP